MKRVFFFLISGALVQAQEPAAGPRFDVATIRLSPDCVDRGRERDSPGRFGVQCVSLREVIRVAYGNVGTLSQGRLPDVLGGPRWIDTDRYDIQATAPGDAGLDQMYGPMMRSLLEDRFHLKLHDEVRKLPVYDLTVLKKAPKLKPTQDGSCVPIDFRTVLQSPPRLNYCGRNAVKTGATIILDGYGVTVAEFITRALRTLDRPVIDQTRLTGRFDIHLEFASTDAPDPGDSTLPSVFTAIQEQLGLKLLASTGPVTVLVIDHVERPSQN